MVRCDADALGHRAAPDSGGGRPEMRARSCLPRLAPSGKNACTPPRAGHAVRCVRRVLHLEGVRAARCGPSALPLHASGALRGDRHSLSGTGAGAHLQGLRAHVQRACAAVAGGLHVPEQRVERFTVHRLRAAGRRVCMISTTFAAPQRLLRGLCRTQRRAEQADSSRAELSGTAKARNVSMPGARGQTGTRYRLRTGSCGVQAFDAVDFGDGKRAQPAQAPQHHPRRRRVCAAIAPQARSFACVLCGPIVATSQVLRRSHRCASTQRFSARALAVH